MGESGFEDWPSAVEEGLAVRAEEVAAGCSHCGKDFGSGFRRSSAGDGKEICDAKPTPGGVQDGEPGDTVGRVKEGTSKGKSVENFGAVPQLLDLESAEGYGFPVKVAAVELGNNRAEVDAGARKDGDAPRDWVTVRTDFAVEGEGLVAPEFDGVADVAGFFAGVGLALAGGFWEGCARGVGIAEDGGMPDDSGCRGGWAADGASFDEGDLWCLTIRNVLFAGGRKDESEVAVKVIDENGLGAEVRAKVEDAEMDVADAFLAHGAKETLDAGLAEEVDRLFRIADEEKGLTVAVPASGKHFDEFVLAGGGVLHLVDEKVSKGGTGGAGKVGGSIVGTKSLFGGHGKFSEVALLAFGKENFELSKGSNEETEKGFGNGPLLIGVAGRR